MRGRQSAVVRTAIVTIAATAAVAVPAVDAGAAAGGLRVHAACATAPPGVARCLALRVDRGVDPALAARDSEPAGWHPADLQSAYRLDPTKGAGQTVAIVDAY